MRAGRRSRHTVVLRFRTDLKPGDRIGYRGRDLEVLAAERPQRAAGLSELPVQRTGGDGMTHPILALQARWSRRCARRRLAALRRCSTRRRRGSAPPYVTIARHDVLPRDGDETPGNEHRLLLHAWAADASRKAVVAMAERLVGAWRLAADARLRRRSAVTLRRHDRTDTRSTTRPGGPGRRSR